MSRLIEQLRATNFPDKSPTDLTLELGQWADENKRDDLFTANPDFAQEYANLKDEIARARRPSYVEEFKGAFGSAVDEMQASGYALGALAAHGAKEIGIPGAEPVRNKLLELMKGQQDEAAQYQPSVGSYRDISSKSPVEDTLRFATYGLGTVAPSMAQAAASSAIGAGIGAIAGTAVEPGGGTAVGAVGGALMGLAEKKLAQKVLSAWLAKGIKTETLEAAAKTLTKDEIIGEAKKLAVEYGAQTALAASSIGQETGSIYADNPESPGTAIGYGIPAGLLDVIPESYVLSRFFKPGQAVTEVASKGAKDYFKRFALEAAKTVPMEGSTEAAQTLLEIAAGKHARGESPLTFTDADYQKALNAGIIGAIGGIGMAPVAAVSNPAAHVDPTSALADQALMRLPPGQAESPGAMDFGSGSELPDFGPTGVLSRDTILPGTQQAFKAAESIGDEGFSPSESEPYLGAFPAAATPPTGIPNGDSAAINDQIRQAGGTTGAIVGNNTPSLSGPVGAPEAVPSLPKSITNTLEKAQEAASAWEVNQASTPETGFGGEAVAPRDFQPAPLDTSPLTPEEQANFQPASGQVTDAPLGNLVGTRVEYQGYTGQLVRDRDGNFMVLPPSRENTKPFWVEVANTGKDQTMLASTAGITPLEPANMTPKPAPGVATPGPTSTSKVPYAPTAPLEKLFPSDLTPVAGLNPSIASQPGTLLTQPAPAAPAPAAPAESGQIQYTIQRPQQHDGRTIPGYIQIERQENNGRGEPLTDAERAAAPQPPEWLPTGQYTEAQVRAAIEKGPPVTLTPMKQAAPTGEQIAAASGNGVDAVPADSVPNLRRLQIFATERAAPAEAETGGQSPRPIESKSIQENPYVALTKAVGKVSKEKSNVAVVLVDNATGMAYQRAAYGGPSNTVNIDMASSRKGTAVGRGSTVSYEADLLNGTEGRPAQKLFAEKLPDGQPRYTIYGIGELKKGGGPANWNMGPAAALNSHPGIQETAKKFWSEQAAARPQAKVEMPAAKSDLESFPRDMAAWRRENRGEAAAALMRARVTEYATLQSKGYDLKPAVLERWIGKLVEGIDTMAEVEQKQTVLLSDDYTAAPASTIDLLQSTLQALTESRNVDVVAFQQGVMGAVDQAAQTTGLVISPASRNKILAFALSSINGAVNAETVLSLLHETGHIVTDGLAEPLRVAFHEAIEQMPWREARWLMNPRSLDIRLLANAEPEQLSPQQRAALERLTPQEIAAARRIDRSALIEEQMAEHLAQLGWDKSEAKSAFQKVVRFLKEVWLRTAMAVQKILKGPDHVSPDLARAYVENRYLQFIHRDSALARDKIYNLYNWLGVPVTEAQKIPVFPAGADWESRMQYIDSKTGQLIPVSHGTHTIDSQTAFLKAALDNAARYVKENPAGGPDTEEIRLTQRANFTTPLSLTPTIQHNTQFAALNLEEEIYAQIAAHADIKPFLTPGSSFTSDWIRLPEKQEVAVRRSEAEAFAKKSPDPLTGQPVVYDKEVTVDKLPSTEEARTDKNGNPIKVSLSESQDKALKITVLALGDAQKRIQRRIDYETERISDLQRIQRRNPADFPPAALKELDELRESLPLRQKIADQLDEQKKALTSKWQPGDIVNVFPTKSYFTVPGPDATEAQIRGAKKGVVPRDFKFVDKTQLAGHLSAMDAWLHNPENVKQGQIYGIIAEQYRKLMDIPTGLQRAGTAALLRRSVTGGLADELTKSGLPGVRLLGKKLFEVASSINRYDESMKTAGRQWSTAAANFAEATGEHFDQGWVERVWDPLMRTWNFIDVSERGKFGTEGEGDLFTTIEKAFKQVTGVDVDTPAKRAKLRELLMASIEAERQTKIVYEAHPNLKVKDEELGIYRRLFSHGLVTGRRIIARHMAGLFQQMNPAWSDTKALTAGDPRAFWSSITDSFGADRAAFDAKVKELFDGYVIPDFVEPQITNNVQQFDVIDEDGASHKASLLRVRQAWEESGKDVTQFALNLHSLEGGKAGAESQTVASVLNAFRKSFEEIKAEHDAQIGAEGAGHEIMARQMMDSRRAQNWPAEWVSYATYDEHNNVALLRQLSHVAAFGVDPFGADGEISNTLRSAKDDLAQLYRTFDNYVRDGKSQRDIEKLMGKDDYTIAKNASKISANLSNVEKAFTTILSSSNYLNGDLKLANEALGFATTMMIANPRSGAQNIISDMLGPLTSLKLSTPALQGSAQAIKTLLADFGNGIVQAFGQNSAFNLEFARARRRVGDTDADIVTSWHDKMNSFGPGLSLAKPVGYEAPLSKAARVATQVLSRARDILPNLGSPLQGKSEAQSLSPKLTWNPFRNSAQSTINATADAARVVFNALAVRGVEYLQKIPASDRANAVRELELGVRDLGNEELGYHGGLILNDKAAFEVMRNALETKIPGESGVGRFVAKAYRAMEAANGEKWSAISDSQFTGILNYSITEWTLQANFANVPHFMQHGPMRPLYTFLTWPYLAMRKFGKQFTDPEGRVTWWGANSTVADGMKTFFLLAAPATIAGSFAIDWYDKYLLGKKQNMRDASFATAIPLYGAISDPAAWVERVGRYGNAGFAGDLVNRFVNYDTQRGLSLDSRIVAISSLSNLINSLAITPFQQNGNVTYASVGRPFLQSVGAGGMLQYLQIANNLLGLNTQDAAINSRINTGNYLRAAGRELNLPVRVATGPSESPTAASPYLQQMELAALVNNRELFQEAYKNAVSAARADHPEDPAKYVSDNFTERHPLKRIFRVTPTDAEYRKMLGVMDEYGANQVRAAINSYNQYLQNWFGKKPYYGKAAKGNGSVEDLLRSANRINSADTASRLDSLVAIP